MIGCDRLYVYIQRVWDSYTHAETLKFELMSLARIDMALEHADQKYKH
jgi:hypothetical protein